MQLITLNKGQPQTGDVLYPDLDEVSKIIFMLHNRKSPGIDRLRPEVIKKVGDLLRYSTLS